MNKIILIFLSVFYFQQSFCQSFQFNEQIKGVDLPTDNLSGITQDDHGLMWFNTASGVFYSDGFDTYSIPDTIQSQLSSHVDVWKDEDGIIWIANSVGVPKAFSYEENRWSEFNFPDDFTANVPLRHIKFFVVKKGNIKMHFFMTPDLLAFSGSDFNNWVKKPMEPNTTGVFKGYFLYQDDLFLFFENKTFMLKDEELVSYEFQGITLPSRIVAVAFDKVKKNYYFLGNDFLASGKSFSQPEKILHKNFGKDTYTQNDYHNLQVKDGEVYYFYNSQLFKYNPDQQYPKLIDTFEFLKSYYISTSFVDREGIIWIGTPRGMVNINSLRFINYGANTLLDDEVTAIMKVKPYSFLIGYNFGLEWWVNGQTKTLFEEVGANGRPDTRITNFSKDKNEIIWFSSNLSGLGRYDPETTKVSFEPCPSERFVTGVNVLGDSLMIMARDRIYLSSINNSGLKHFENDITEEILKELDQDVIFIRKAGRLGNGKLIFMQGGTHVVPEVNDESKNFLTVVGYDYLESGDSLLLATETGLKMYKNGNLDFVRVNEETINHPVYSLLKDTKGNIWAGTDQGVFVLGNNLIRKFNDKNGLIGNEINRGALVNGEEDRVMIGTQKGLSVYFPNEDVRPNVSPLVEILSVEILSPTFREVDLERIPYSENSIEIRYRAVSFQQQANLSINYMLEGYHEDWMTIESPRSNLLVFNNLPPGEYTLKLQAKLAKLATSEVVTSSSFRILKPLYLQNWVVILVLLFFLGVGFLLNTLLDQFRNQGILKKAIDQKTKEAIQTEDQFRNVWKSSQDGLLLSLIDGKILAVNPSFSRLVEIPEDELEATYVQDLYADPEYYETQRAILLQAIEDSDGKGEILEMKMPFKNGTKEIEIYVTKLQSEFKGQSVNLTVIRDISEKKQYEKGLQRAKEKAEEANRIKSNFLSNMSHEIRTPLNGILGSTENIILENQDDPILLSKLEIIMESGERLLKTINSILDLSKIEANKINIVYKEIKVNDFLGKILLPLKSLAIKKGLLITTKYFTHPLIGLIDKRYFEMIVNNLVGNAIKYSIDGLIIVRLTGDEDSIVLEVEDKGIGMSEEFQKKLFDPFEQESQGYGRSFEGSGLGLTITKNLVDLLGGSIHFFSEQGKGTHVKVILPFGKN